MHLRSVRSSKIYPHDDMYRVLDAHLQKLKERTILAITSKIVSLCEGAFIPQNKMDKETLIKQEADLYLPPHPQAAHRFYLTLKHSLLIPSAGIDESNSDGAYYILYPRSPFESARKVWGYLRKRDNLQHLGVIITDSHTVPLRRGVRGCALSWCGFEPLKNYVGTRDCFGKALCYTYRNNSDALAAAAVFMMGEGNEQTPFCLIEGLKDILFCNYPPTEQDKQSALISIENDLYGPLLSYAPWEKGCTSIK